MTELASNKSGSRLISRILPPAIRLWLTTQLDDVENLIFRIEGRDREILSGHISNVSLSAERAVYQGIHLSQAAVQASGIHINLGQVIRRQPLRLLAPFPVSGTALLSATDLNKSLQSPLLGEGLYDFLVLLAKSQPEADYLKTVLGHLPERTVLSHYQPIAAIESHNLILRLVPRPEHAVSPVAISTQLEIREGHRLCLKAPHWLIDDNSTDTAPLPAIHGFEIDLGSEVTLTHCEIQSDHVALSGTVQVLPEKS
ncbi:DUF2993 domain-containing protein [Oscillatoria sp. CS-180]|uniref:LmeA family phospholipid-binding protein n=1 Tax=Oscillatoria sp. CS-180 TaxID=3021720 RepID=UPI00232CEB35|nr:DUF2993 domain-containing protein [Oscillatoria sp. CS-180]MDB9528747.1 DUF2993 domain-containing protein [Oscillatoria sp. CS-180]